MLETSLTPPKQQLRCALLRDFAYLLFALGLVNAVLLSAAILPLATAYNICEGSGAESGVNKRFSDAPVFYWPYTFLIVCVALDQADPVLTGGQWRSAPVSAGFNVDFGKSQRTDGRLWKFQNWPM